MSPLFAFVLPAFCMGWGDYDWDNTAAKLSVEVMSHSFSSPFTYDSSYSNWFMSGATISTRNSRSSLVLNPAIPSRQGMLWNRKVIESNDFDATLMIHLDEEPAKGGNRVDTPVDQRVGLWFTATNMTDKLSQMLKTLPNKNPDWKESYVTNGLDTKTGVPTKFDGVGFVISPTNAGGKKVPSVTVVTSAGIGQPVDMFAKMKADQSSPTQLVYLRFKLKVRPDSVSVWFNESMEWRQLAEVKVNVPKRGFIGLTAYSGSDSIPYRARVSSLHIKSYDLNAMNTEENQATLAIFEKHGLTLKDLLADESYSNPVAQTETLSKLSKVLAQYLTVEVPSFKMYHDTILNLQKEVVSLESFVTDLTKEARYTFANDGGRSGVQKLRQELKNIMGSVDENNGDEAERERLLNRMKDLAKDHEEGSGEARHMAYYQRSLGERTDQLNEALQSQNRFTLILFLVVVGAAVGMGVLFYVRLNKYGSKAHLF